MGKSLLSASTSIQDSANTRMNANTSIPKKSVKKCPAITKDADTDILSSVDTKTTVAEEVCVFTDMIMWKILNTTRLFVMKI